MMAAKGKDGSTSNLKRTLTGRKIMVVRWMMLDKDHCNASENTNPGGAHNWRATLLGNSSDTSPWARPS